MTDREGITITVEKATVYRIQEDDGFISRRYLSKYRAVRAYCIYKIMERYNADGYDDEAEHRNCLYHGCAGDDSDLLDRYYRYCLAAFRKVTA